MSPRIGSHFSSRPFLRHDITQNLYKGVYGESVLFEEVNHDLQLVFVIDGKPPRSMVLCEHQLWKIYQRRRSAFEFVDGIQNILPQGLGSEMQLR